ncbi:TetR/AcrR family transcriptional regulator [Desulfovibrio sp. TomC]|uniref:TetR/AcrR family transcriptional regulator n=1 Tax=Desulfovibrio sp. TomC TaxID=1562888 RepID=UPI0005740564|nr:TetR/AcrR family transcriptional regulator [Desulfovibrio sp. TomC]KHK03548.1 Transcriptional regulator, TetR family [Desulfovibrio sp. TomC]
MDEPTTTGLAPGHHPKRRRNAAATRQAILDSARLAFTRCGYDGVGVREIAQNAGVTAMLVNRYFGSKERLFEEVVEATLATPGILRHELTRPDRTVATLAQNMARTLVAKTEPGVSPLDGILLLIRSAANPQAATILRDHAQQHLQPLVDILSGPGAPQRAALLLAVIAGFQLMRQIIGLSALTEAEPADLARQLEGLFQSLTQGFPSEGSLR